MISRQLAPSLRRVSETYSEAANATSSQAHHSDAVCPTPLRPRCTSKPRLENILRERGCHARLSTKKMPYSKDKTEMMLNEMAEARGAPMKPSRNGFGPHTFREKIIQSPNVSE